MIRRALALSAATILATAPVLGQSVRALGEFRDWSAYSASEGAGPVCFAMTKPTDIAPLPDGYAQAYLYLTHRPAEGMRNEVNLVAGFSFAPDTTATLSISGQSFDLFTEGDAAWLLDPTRSDALASAIRAGSSLTIEGTTDRGIRVIETFSLSGATAASRAIETC
jgi:hypothetical protein